MLLFAGNPANAQELPSPAPQKQVQVQARAPQSNIPVEQQMLNQLPESVRANMKPGVSYTVGYQTQKGWENGLVHANHNLGHYYWSPITNMVHATPSQKTGAQAQPAAPLQKREFHYVKPVKAALPVNPNVKLPTPMRAVAKNLPGSSARRDVSAKIAFRRSSEDVNGQLVSTDTQAKVYADYGSYKSNQSASGYLTNKDAYGKLLND